MFLSKIEVNDFQSIEKTSLEFKERPSGGSITTIVGASSAGKSALLRAANLWARNSSSVPVRIQSKKNATVKISGVVGEHTVSVERGKSLSTYKIDDTTYSKAGTVAPEAVQKTLNLFSSSPELHFAFQFDPPYLLSETGTTISSVLGYLTQASVLRDAMKEGNRRSLAAKRLVSTRREDVQRISTQIEVDYSNLDKESKTLESTGALLQTLNETQTTLDSASVLVERAATALIRSERADSSDFQTKDAHSLLDKVSDALRRVTEIEQTLLTVEKFVAIVSKQSPKVDASEALRECESLLERLKCEKPLENALNTLANYTVVAQRSEKIAQEMSAVDAEIREVNKALPRCAECGQLITQEHLDMFK